VFVYFYKNVYIPVKASLNAGVISFTTNHFSEYVVSAEQLVYTITFRPGTAEGDEYVQNVDVPAADKDGNKIAKNIKLIKCAFTKDNATFDHWTPGNYADEATIDVSGDMTLTAVWKNDNTGNIISGGSSYGGGGGSSSNVSIVTKVTGGKVTVSPSRPTKGQTVTLNIKPADGYKLDAITVTDSKGNTIELTKVSDDKYTFVMPAGKITVTPTFVKIDGSDKKDDETTNVNKRFSDLAADAWYAEYINYIAENGLMNGYEDGRFGPNDNVTREQIAAILYRYAAYKEFDTTLSTTLANFSEAAKVSGWAQNAISWAVAEGLMNGDNGALRPQGNATRAEIAALLMRFSENIAK